MRVRKIEIARWRNFENVSISLADNTSLVCLVGSNGTGKTHILELISACAHHIGLSAGINIPRGNPFEDTDHDFSLEVFLARGVSTALDATFGEAADHVAWDRTLRVTSRRLANESHSTATVSAGAGGWIIQSTLSRADAIEFSQLPAECRALAHALTWDRIATDIDGALEPISGMSGFVDEKKAKLKHRLNVFARIYERKRASENLWKVCEGKEICKVIARDLGFSDATALEKAAVTFWNSAPNKVPTEVQQLRGELEAV